jgi:hypothetical protein
MPVLGIVGRMQIIRPMMAGTAAVVDAGTEAIAGMMVIQTIVD